ncbi:hypothetical protein [Algoriphagus sp.]|uniref:hypothetical protein n=1 Tax=Algoriphagus sp. TaxID=1872435 RepID=UPI003F6E8C63
MEIQNTINWHHGEIFEGKFILGFGLFLIITSLLFYFLGNTPTAKALLFPLLVAGGVFVAIGASMNFSNQKIVAGVEAAYAKDKSAFVEAEKKRVEDFQYLYPMSIGISLACFLIALGLLYFVKNVHWQAIAISLIFFGTAFAIIDYFSKERANIYYEQLNS